ncbi:MAG: GTP 3',8-cyclase MoaA [Lachnospiraceae bacterium]|nr:GTP 3',8-cyclase MoaA [Lachnospiraceae bacterium]
MLDQYGRKIEYMRISVTDRCNLRCRYCMPEEGVQAIPREEILTFEEIERIVRVSAGLGIHSVRLTGGEPLARKGIASLVSKILSVPDIRCCRLTTNGILLEDQLPELLEAGLGGVNISLDTMTPVRFMDISRRDMLDRVFAGMNAAIAAAKRESHFSVKINCVPMKGFNEDELAKIALLAKDRPISVRFIELMPIGLGNVWQGMAQEEVMEVLARELGIRTWRTEEERSGSGPAVYYRPDGWTGSIGFISAMSHKFCESCNRIRLTSDGLLKSCLQYTATTDLRDMMRGGCSDEDLEGAIRDVIFRKPKSHSFLDPNPDPARETRKMSGIGG